MPLFYDFRSDEGVAPYNFQTKKSDRLKWTLSRRTARGHIPTLEKV